ncbi:MULTISPECIES: DUF5683 domain-containing protein [Chryseobacterium]|uniref:DUF5683 domain-containing protein n=1 Tax=Chryseobacterium caseinilyticum TaxID=2771428 RepID=A0ABR8ZC04_9FLAO|nr:MULTISPECIES: DUF5683 domain-containing protein [Chryseobacterium]KQS91598.1 hypothetical protein ASG21_03760 [Chryseobacterium sp. Leaf394]MBD8082777.1 hypothetical protein [Chryseobacterium caseinilyticum]
MKKVFLAFFIFIFSLSFAQIVTPTDSLRLDHYAKDSIPAAKPKNAANVVSEIEKVNAPAKKNAVKKLNPTKAGLYSAVLPGLGQVYNKKYWKVPIVLGAVGTGAGIAIWNQNQYLKYREYFIAKLNGTPNEFVDERPYLDAIALGNAQDRIKRQRDYAIAITGLIYILNIVDAVVDAHLYEGRKDPDLTIAPAVIYDDFRTQPPKTGLALNFRF